MAIALEANVNTVSSDAHFAPLRITAVSADAILAATLLSKGADPNPETFGVPRRYTG